VTVPILGQKQKFEALDKSIRKAVSAHYVAKGAVESGQPVIDMSEVLGVIATLAAEIIQGAPQHIGGPEKLFMDFAETVARLAGLREEQGGTRLQ
jgi:hypothetical protein